MLLIKPKVIFEWMTQFPLEMIEQAGRTCWKSESKADSTPLTFAAMLLRKGHEAMIEHASMSYRFICDRGVTHEMVRHRLASYAQESTRYCSYGGGVTFIIPPWVPMTECEYQWGKNVPFRVGADPFVLDEAAQIWLESILRSEILYKELLEQDWKPQQARSVLPNSLKTEIVMTANLREWRHFFELRTAKTAHPQMREVALMCLKDAAKRIPVVFDEYLCNLDLEL